MLSNKTLARQLKRGLGLDSEEALQALQAALNNPGAEGAAARLAELAVQLPRLFDMVAESYAQFDRDLTLRTRSLELSSTELSEANEQLRTRSNSQKQVLDALRATANELLADAHQPPLADEDQDLFSLTTLMSNLARERELALQAAKAGEERIRSLIYNLPGCVFRVSVSPKLQVYFLSDGIFDLIGYTAEECLIDPHQLYLQSVGPEQQARNMALLAESISNKSPYQNEYKVSHRNGSVKWVVERGRGVFDEEGNLLYVDGVVLDNTAIKAAQEEISRTRGQLVSAIESLDVGFVMYDQDERLLICNQTFREMHPAIAGWLSPGMPYEFIARAHYQAGAPDANGMDEETWLQQKLEQQRTGEGVREIQVGDRWIRREDSRTEDGLHVSLRTDITPLKQLMLELMHAKEAAEAASLAKSQFLANMSHEIRTPMNGIIGMTELALDTQLDAEQEEYLQLVRSSANSLLVIINDILDFSKIEAGKLHIDAIPFSLRNTLADTLKSLALRAHEKGLELVSIIDTAVPDQLRADPGRLRQLIINLMGNAIKFTEAGEIEMRIGMAPDSMRSDSLHRKLHVSIRDTGIGIPQEKLGLIFEAFSQADTSTTRRYGGTGLGLAISSRLVELMGGKLWVESELGVGSTFHFTIEVEIIGTPIQTPSTPRLAQVQGMRVLMVDDNATNRRWLTQLLSGWGMRPTIAASGAEALDIVNRISEPFSLILLDGSMPEMSGFDVAESLSRRHDINATTIMMLTSSGERGDATRCGELGIDGYLVKPISQTELLDAILIALGQHQAHQAQEISKPPLVTRHVVAEQRYRLHILLVEDNPVNQKLAVRLLEKLGHRIVVAENGQEALDFSADGQFDLVLMDVQMPVMGGLEATRLIREREAGSSQHLPIVAMTANAMQGDREICLQAGMDGYVSKPINPQILIEEIDRVLDRLGNPDAPAAAAAAVAPTVTEVINFDAIDMKEALARLGGDRGLLREIANIFLDDYPKRLEEVRAAISVEDGVQLSRAAHNIKGVAGNLSANPLREVALEMEAAGKRGDIGHARNLLRDLEKRLSELARVLENLPRD